ncbi:unnamed protein product [Closterium sp. NIES-53]
MASLRVLAFDHEGRPLQFDKWLDDLQLYLLSDSRDSVSLFDHTSGIAPTPPATADSATRSQWLTRDAAARLDIRNHLPLAECVHFGQHRTAQALYDAVVARYSSPASAALGRLLLAYLFPELDHFLSLDPTVLTIDLLEQHLLAAETSAVATSLVLRTSGLLLLVRSAATARARVARVVAGAAGVVVVVGAAGVVVGAAVEVVKAVEAVAALGVVAGVGALVVAVDAAVGVAVVAAVGVVAVGLELSVEILEEVRGSGSSVGERPHCPRSFTCGKPHTQHRCFSRLDDAWRAEFGDEVERHHLAELLRSGVAIFDLDYDAILSAMYALSASAEGDCYRCVPPNPGIEAAALGASESSLPGTAPAEALHTFTKDSGPHAVSFVTAPPSLLSLHLSRSDWMTPPRAQSLPIPPLFSRVRRFRLTRYPVFTSPRSLQTWVESVHTVYKASSGSCVCSGCPRQVSLPRSLPPIPPSPAPPYLPCVEGRQCAAPHSSSFPPTSAPLQTLHMDDLPFLRLHSNRGGEFSSDPLQDILSWGGHSPEVSIPFYRLFPYRFAPPTPLPLFLAPSPPPIDPLPPQGPAPSVRGCGGARSGGGSGGAEPGGAEPGGTEPAGVEPGGAEPEGVEPGGSESEGAESGGVEPWGAALSGGPAGASLRLSPQPKPLSPQQLHEWLVRRARLRSGPAGAGDPAEPRGARVGGPRAGSTGASGAGAGAGVPGAGGAVSGGTGAGGTASASPRRSPRLEPLSPQQLREWLVRSARLRSGAAGAGATGAIEAGGAEVTIGAGGVGGAGAGTPTEPGAAGAGGARAGGTSAGGAGAGGAGASGAGAGGTGVGGAGAGGAGAVHPGAGGTRVEAGGGTGAGDTVRPRPFFVPLLQQVLSVLSSTGLTPPLLCPPPDQSQPPLPPASPHLPRLLTLSRPEALPSVVSLRLVLPPLFTLVVAFLVCTLLLSQAHTLWHFRARAATPNISRLLATVVTDPSFEYTAASGLVAELLDFAATSRLDYTTALVAESESASPPSIGGECSLSTDVLEDKQEDFECLAAAIPRFDSMLLAREGDLDAPDIPTPRSYEEAITVDGMWIFRVKWPPGSPPAFKARYVARGFSQRQGVDNFQTFPPTPKMTTLRVLLHVAAQRDYELHSLDFSIAFLTTLAALGFTPSTTDPSLFLRTDTLLPPFYILVYVLQRFGFQFSSPLPTPLPTGHSLSAPPSDESIEPSGPYRELVGCLMYLMTCTRPDLAYPLSLLARYVAPGRHRKVHWDAAKRVLCYLCSTSGMGLVLGGRGLVVLIGHADASEVDDSATQRSSQGYTFSLGSGSVSWRSTRSSSVLSSSCEAEIYAGAMAAQELRWLTYLLTDLGEQPRSPPQRGQLRLAFVATRTNTADIFTKALPPACFDFLDWSCDHLFSPTLPMRPTMQSLFGVDSSVFSDNMKRVVAALYTNLVKRKSKQYDDEVLAQFFLMNNGGKMEKLCGGEGGEMGRGEGLGSRKACFTVQESSTTTLSISLSLSPPYPSPSPLPLPLPLSLPLPLPLHLSLFFSVAI